MTMMMTLNSQHRNQTSKNTSLSQRRRKTQQKTMKMTSLVTFRMNMILI